VLEARSGTKFLTNFANPTLWTLFGSHKELGGVSVKLNEVYTTIITRILDEDNDNFHAIVDDID
jgi:hypothetical protein